MVKRFSKICMFLLLILITTTSIFGPIFAEGEPYQVQAPDFNFSIEGNGTPKISVSGKSAEDLGVEDGANVGDVKYSAWNTIFEEYKGFIMGIYGLFIMTCVLIFVISFAKLGASAGNPQARKNAIIGIACSGVGTALLGSLGLIFYLAFRFLK